MKNFNSLSAPRVADIRIDLVDRVVLLEKLRHSISLTAVKPPLEIIHTINPEICMYAWKNPAYRLTLNAGTANVVDGIGLKLALKRVTKRKVQRICGSDLIFDLAEISLRSGRTLMLLGGSPSRVEKASAHLEQKFPGLRVIGCSPPYSSTLPLLNQKEIEQLIIETRPAVIAVCLGAPKQELWIQAYKDFLHLHDVRIAAGLGGTIDFLSGEIPRAPVWIRKLGLEWLYRLSIEPKRWKRQISTLPKFAALSLFSHSFMHHD
ncbi:glycosyltransferase [Patescibacteria group bacterium]|nr:MAG: glycosyltransferase [Patescibacteria group bacterium]